ncbi:hypothetical protein, partial [Flavobacterium columnare]|uniref:hypothetical protein n=1 Tax=Flavobacterium columnare TaxID=996 RepID=UPI001C6147AF
LVLKLPKPKRTTEYMNQEILRNIIRVNLNLKWYYNILDKKMKFSIRFFHFQKKSNRRSSI